jgi:hypothetical protein
LVLAIPRTVTLFFGIKRSDGQSPVRSVSYSRKNPELTVADGIRAGLFLKPDGLDDSAILDCAERLIIELVAARGL